MVHIFKQLYSHVFNEQIEIRTVENFESKTATMEQINQFSKMKKKLRNVFYASTKKNGFNLNEILLKRPKSTPLIFDIFVSL